MEERFWVIWAPPDTCLVHPTHLPSNLIYACTTHFPLEQPDFDVFNLPMLFGVLCGLERIQKAHVGSGG
ncbi:hypothetical protein PAXRUDRAFT_823022 [Paxillus rubicundulus Ve08.2h10]|uniref:Unplaced genomic scaffold scaffold_45, whole genome shotgun sequence n=1 Tax=Paxillus rubicundulus Ve08.2h10 TaxID=930991 RepID=A0A0D0ECD7_9AGAM|nr:hypothetical protein PAXRUDRAFT_823022 [Paxillus rubicundulus Ve08.2h10]